MDCECLRQQHQQSCKEKQLAAIKAHRKRKIELTLPLSVDFPCQCEADCCCLQKEMKAVEKVIDDIQEEKYTWRVLIEEIIRHYPIHLDTPFLRSFLDEKHATLRREFRGQFYTCIRVSAVGEMYFGPPEMFFKIKLIALRTRVQKVHSALDSFLQLSRSFYV